MTYAHQLTLAQPYHRAVESVRAALFAQGFGIITEIDMRATFEAKIDAAAAQEIGDYVILGACNPGLARQALAAEPQLGALLPCNVIVRRGEEGRSIVEAMDPMVMVQLSDSEQVRAVAEDADARLRAALGALAGE
ncbi:DUF302 domain-containing protein [Brachybacterium vulturis]|uniref:DUF302 domain-containing protein n=1 Tax=Brachybacterium vulturis TaxID=2017484 RepID=UPI003735E889